MGCESDVMGESTHRHHMRYHDEATVTCINHNTPTIIIRKHREFSTNRQNVNYHFCVHIDLFLFIQSVRLMPAIYVSPLYSYGSDIKLKAGKDRTHHPSEDRTGYYYFAKDFLGICYLCYFNSII